MNKHASFSLDLKNKKKKTQPSKNRRTVTKLQNKTVKKKLFLTWAQLKLL